MHKTAAFNRKDLYDKVWETPLTRLAQTIGVSDVALAKSCRRADIPLPGRGYWAKAERDRSRKPPLPKLKDDYYEVIRFQIAEDDNAQTQIKAKREKGQPIAMPDSLDSPHPLIAQTLKEAGKAKDSEGRLRLNQGRALDIRVTPGSLDRAARLLDALIKASEAKGHVWRIIPDGQTSVGVNDETLHVFLHEKLSRHELPPPPRPPRTRGPRPWEPDLDALLRLRKRYEWRPTGLLTFSIDGLWFTRSVRKNWNDTERGSLDAKLNEILAGFAPAAAAVKAHREDCERRQKADKERAARRLEEERRIAHQHHLRACLVRATQQWEKTQRLRAFLAAVSNRLDDLPTEQQAATRSWLQWAAEQIDKLDPLQGDLSHLVSLEPPPDTSIAYGPPSNDEWDWWSIKRKGR